MTKTEAAIRLAEIIDDEGTWFKISEGKIIASKAYLEALEAYRNAPPAKSVEGIMPSPVLEDDRENPSELHKTIWNAMAERHNKAIDTKDPYTDGQANGLAIALDFVDKHEDEKGVEGRIVAACQMGNVILELKNVGPHERHEMVGASLRIEVIDV